MGHEKGAGLRVVLIAITGLLGALVCVVGYFSFCVVFRGSISEASIPVEATPQVFLPFIVRAQGASEPALTIYDLDGTERDWDWLIATFGAVSLERGTGTASVAVLRAIKGPTALVVHVENSGGDPLEKVPVVFYWPDAPELPSDQRFCGLDRGLIGYTNPSGDVGFGMGKGAFYSPPGAGPHVVWVAIEGTDCLRGLGMLSGTDHIHLDSVWRMP